MGILAVSAKDPAPKLLLPPFDVPTNGAILHELGESFHLRGIAGQEDNDFDAASSAQQISEDSKNNFPLQNKPAVSLLIYYDGKPVSLEFLGGEAWIPEPKEGQKVTMAIERLDSGRLALGAVLKVNGENTLCRERFRDFECQKWVLRPDWLKTPILGFQIDDNHAEEFRVASREESRGLEVYYGPDVGTISLVVFEELPPDAPAEQTDLAEDSPMLDGNESLDLNAVGKARFPKSLPKDANNLKEQLRHGETLSRRSKSRGLIVEGGNTITRPVRDERYRWSPEPILSIVVRYYHPKNPIPSH